MPDRDPITNITDPRWLRAISHPVRIRLLAMLDEEPASPVILAAKLDQPLGTIAYHVRTLYDLGLLKLVKTRQRRGATEHYYTTTGHPATSEEAWGELDAVSKQRLLTALIAKANDYATRSAAAGGFDSKEAHISTNSLRLDEKGWQALAKETQRWLAKVQQIEADAAARIDQKQVEAVNVGLTMMLFQALPFSAVIPASTDGAGDGNGEVADAKKRTRKTPAKGRA